MKILYVLISTFLFVSILCLFVKKRNIESFYIKLYNNYTKERKYYIKFQIPKNNFRYKHIDGIPTHYAHIIKDMISPLLKYKKQTKATHIFLYTPSNYNPKFRKIVSTILPFVEMVDYINVNYTIIDVNKDDKKDLHELNIYSKRFSIDRCFKRYILLINRGKETNGVSRSIINFNLLESNIEQFCQSNDYELKSIILEDLDIYDQIFLFKYASIIIAQNGASLVNTVWCENCNLVIEYVTNNNIWFVDFIQFSKEWVRDNYEMNHINIDIKKTISILNKFNNKNVIETNKETITLCLWIPPYHPIDNLKYIVKEYVNYYLHIGIDDIICCNNGMDKFKDVVDKCLFIKDDKQMGFYNNCLNFCKTKWMCCFDLDEFLVNRYIYNKNSFKIMMNKNNESDILYIHWRIIGHNNIQEYNDKEYITKQYIEMTCKDFKDINIPNKGTVTNWGGNKITKWIGKTNQLKKLEKLTNMHILKIHRNMKTLKLEWNDIRLNHYYILSKKMLKSKQTKCKTFIGEINNNGVCKLSNGLSFREHIQNEIDKSKKCQDKTMLYLDF
jgi:hypothetical protein